MQNLIHEGFTLIELMVVVTIIGILLASGILAFATAQRNSRDAKRMADIEAIAQTLEQNYSSGTYQALQASWFPSGSIPLDPRVSNAHSFASGCGANMPSPGVNDPACWYCIESRSVGPTYCKYSRDGWSDQGTLPVGGWCFCANLESGNYYCMCSRQ